MSSVFVSPFPHLVVLFLKKHVVCLLDFKKISDMGRSQIVLESYKMAKCCVLHSLNCNFKPDSPVLPQHKCHEEPIKCVYFQTELPGLTIIYNSIKGVFNEP